MSLHPRLARLEDWELPDDFPFDYSRASLDVLEAIVLERFDGGDPVSADAVISYLGEALLRVGGGSWVWDDDPASASYDLPLARPDEGLDLPRVSPMHLLVEAVRRRSGDQFARVHAALEEAAADRTARVPGGRRPRRTPPASMSTTRRFRRRI